MENHELIGGAIGVVGLAMIFFPKVVSDIGGSWSKAMGAEPDKKHPMNSMIVFRILGLAVLVAGCLLYWNPG